MDENGRNSCRGDVPIYRLALRVLECLAGFSEILPYGTGAALSGHGCAGLMSYKCNREKCMCTETRQDHK